MATKCKDVTILYISHLELFFTSPWRFPHLQTVVSPEVYCVNNVIPTNTCHVAFRCINRGNFSRHNTFLAQIKEVGLLQLLNPKRKAKTSSKFSNIMFWRSHDLQQTLGWCLIFLLLGKSWYLFIVSFSVHALYTQRSFSPWCTPRGCGGNYQWSLFFSTFSMSLVPDEVHVV